MAPEPDKNTPARRKLELSQLSIKAVQREAMGADFDLEQFSLYLSSVLQTNLVERIVDGQITRSIDAASTLEITVNDYDRSLLNSGLLVDGLDVQVDGLWFRLASQDKNGDELVLTFEDREIAILRKFDKWLLARRSKMTRAEFVFSMIREATPTFGKPIPTVIPQLHTVQPVQQYDEDNVGVDSILNKVKGINPPGYNSSNLFSPPGYNSRNLFGGSTLYVKSVPATAEQTNNANIILATGHSMGASRKVLVCGIMTAITESVLRNNPGGDRDSAGLFQQRPGWGSYGDRTNPETSARLFFRQAIAHDATEPDVPYQLLCQDVQRSGTSDGSNYAPYRTEAERFVTAYGTPGGDVEMPGATVNAQAPVGSAGGDFYFYRGNIKTKAGKKIRKPENSWACIQRLADEVDNKAFFINGVFYYIAEDVLIKQRPIFTLNEFDDGIIDVSGSYDNNKNTAELNITARVGRWNAPPGSVVAVENLGVWNGRWLVSEFTRSLFELTATITLTKDRPALPEPIAGTNATDIQTTWFPQPGTPTGTRDRAAFGGIQGVTTDGSRNAVVRVALAAYAEEQVSHYNYAHPRDGRGRPYPDSLWSAAAHGDQSQSTGIDCSSFATLVYKEAGAPDPNNSGYNGQGYTGTLVANGIGITVPQPGDLVFYGGTQLVPEHVGVFVGNNEVVEIGSESGIQKIAYNYRAITAFRSYLPL